MPSDQTIRSNFGNWTSFLAFMFIKPLKFIPTKNGLTRLGTRNEKREKVFTASGYCQIFEPEHPTSNSSGYCMEHRMVAWDDGTLTDLTCIVHHKNGVKTDNRVENLEVMTNKKHTSLHNSGVKKSTKSKTSCIVKSCDIKTSSKYGLCTKHYKSEWDKKKCGRDSLLNIHKNADLLEGR